jgi:hypothetical protein
MKVSKLIDAWGVPVMIAVGSFFFWFHIREAPAVAARVPHIILIFIAVLLLIVGQRIAKQQSLKKGIESDISFSDRDLLADLATRKKSPSLDLLRRHAVLVFFALGLIYFLTFEILGFSISNFIFVFSSMIVVKNYQADFSFRNLPTVLITSLITTGLLYLFAKLTSFNIPNGIFGI